MQVVQEGSQEIPPRNFKKNKKKRFLRSVELIKSGDKERRQSPRRVALGGLAGHTDAAKAGDPEAVASVHTTHTCVHTFQYVCTPTPHACTHTPCTHSRTCAHVDSRVCTPMYVCAHPVYTHNRTDTHLH